MTRRMRLAALECVVPALLALACPVGAQPEPTYRNPVIDGDFPDPSVMRAPDGVYYAYATQGEAAGQLRNIQLARSRDLVHWTQLGDALPVKPGWASRTQDFWAPHIMRRGSRYLLYYSARPDTALINPKRGLCLAVATARRPEGPFTDSGQPLECGEGFANIDPMAFDDPATGKHLLYWGSGFAPIHVRQLADDGLSFAPGSHAIDLVYPAQTKGPADYQRLIEGAWVIRRQGWYYLFFSGDNCCGPEAHYAVLVARSRSATGPFQVHRDPRTGRALPVVAANQAWLAPGHNAVVADRAGRSWMLYHGVDAAHPRAHPTDQVNTRRVLLLDPLVFSGGWPMVAGGVPSSAPRPAPRIR